MARKQAPKGNVDSSPPTLFDLWGDAEAVEKLSGESEPANLDLKTEEDVKVKFLLPYLNTLGYKLSCCDFEKAIEVHEGRKQKTIFADVVVYTSPAKIAPLIVCDTKAPKEILDRSVREQAVSYARLLPQIAPLALITNGTQTQVFQTLNKNRIPELPARKDLNRDLLHFLVSADVQDSLRQEAKHELFIIDDVQTFKSILKACHNEIRNNEGYDPTVAFDEMAKVLFCKLYEEKRATERQGEGNRFRTAIFDDTLERLGVNVIKQILAETKLDARYSGLFAPDTAINLQDRTVRKIVALFENYDLSLTAFDVKGEAFEYFLGDTFTGGLGEYFTPRNVVEFIVECIDPKIGEKIVDPFCGTGGFLIYAFEVVNEKIRLQEFSDEEKARWRQMLSNESLFGTDWKERTSQACKMNMMVHGDGSAGIFMHHGFVNIAGKIEDGIFTICLTNPPFGSLETDRAILNQYELGKGRNSQDRVILAIERALRLVKPNGRIGMVVIDGVLNNSSTKYVRDYIKKNAWILGVVSLDEATFEGYGARAKTSILFLQKKAAPDEGTQRPVFMAVASNTGYAPNGAPIAGNELPDIRLDYQAFLQGKEPRYRSNSWTQEVLQDRLDVQFYWQQRRPARQEAISIESVQTSIAQLFDQLNAGYATISAALTQMRADEDTRRFTLDELLEETREREILRSDASYTLLGVRWWGAGAFIREEKLGSEIKSRTLFRVHKGWLIYNRLFAFRGSFAVLGEEHDGCYVSGEFPTFRVRDQIPEPELTARYIVHCLNSPQYLAVVDALSTGSTKTSRNRLNQKVFLGLSIAIPKAPDALAARVETLDTLQGLQASPAALAEQFKMLQAGVTGLLPKPAALS